MSGPPRVPLTGYPRLDDATALARAQAFVEAARTRRTVRDFAPDPVPREIIETCLTAATLAPNGANLQPWRFVAIADADVKRAIREAAEEEERAFYGRRAGEEWLEALAPLGTDADKPFLQIAPWLIAVFGERRAPDADGRGRKNYYVPESVCIATGFLLLALHAAGLATLTHTPSPMGFLNRLCGRPDTEKPYILLVVGHPAPGATVPAHATARKPLAEVATFLCGAARA